VLAGAGALVAVSAGCGGGEARIREALQRTTGVIRLPAGDFVISAELTVPPGAHDLRIIGSPAGTSLHAAAGFRGRALLRLGSARDVRISDINFDGNRDALEQRVGLPPGQVPYEQFYTGHGIFAEDVDSLTIEGANFRKIPGFAILVARSSGVVIEGVQIEDSGSRNANGRNNASGGILLESAVVRFDIRHCVLRNVRGNGIWTHAYRRAPRHRGGLISGNRFWNIGRDAIQIGHAVNVRVENNAGTRIGYPVEEVDVESGGTPVAIDTAGNVENTVYAANRFEEVNGKCIDLDGFHHGEVVRNTCLNRGPAEDYPHGNFGISFNNANPDMESKGVVVRENEIHGAKYGGIFVIGSGHSLVGNRLRALNLARCDEESQRPECRYKPEEKDLLRSGIYLAAGAERPSPARGLVIEDNEISGYRMSTHCIGAAPGVSAAGSRLARNHCADGGAP
jgi:hypothetical protein